MKLDLKRAKVIVTGGASHIGQAIAFAFAHEGASIAIIDKDAPQAERTAKAARERGAAVVFIVEADLSDRAQGEDACARGIAALGGIDVLVTNVGSNHPNFFLELDPDGWQRTIDLNLTSVMACVRAVLPEMIKARRGAIIAITSIAAFGEPRQSVYAAAKAGVIGF